jgi:hypothetical protein
MTNALGLYRSPGLILLPYFPNKGLEIHPAKLNIPKTNPDCDVLAPLDFASVGKNGGSIEQQIPQTIYAEETVIANNTALGFVIIIADFMLNCKKTSIFK